MLDLLVSLEYMLEVVVNYAIFLFTLVGVLIMIWTGVTAVWNFLKKDTHMGLKLAEGMALALQFKLGAEILRTVVIREPKELIIVGGIIVMRMALTLLIHWEIKKNKGEDIFIMEEAKQKRELKKEKKREKDMSSEG